MSFTSGEVKACKWNESFSQKSSTCIKIFIEMSEGGFEDNWGWVIAQAYKLLLYVFSINFLIVTKSSEEKNEIFIHPALLVLCWWTWRKSWQHWLMNNSKSFYFCNYTLSHEFTYTLKRGWLSHKSLTYPKLHPEELDSDAE